MGFLRHRVVVSDVPECSSVHSHQHEREEQTQSCHCPRFRQRLLLPHILGDDGCICVWGRCSPRRIHSQLFPSLLPEVRSPVVSCVHFVCKLSHSGNHTQRELENSLPSWGR